jgi:hypothetical protein
VIWAPAPTLPVGWWWPRRFLPLRPGLPPGGAVAAVCVVPRTAMPRDPRVVVVAMRNAQDACNLGLQEGCRRTAGARNRRPPFGTAPGSSSPHRPRPPAPRLSHSSRSPGARPTPSSSDARREGPSFERDASPSRRGTPGGGVRQGMGVNLAGLRCLQVRYPAPRGAAQGRERQVLRWGRLPQTPAHQ